MKNNTNDPKPLTDLDKNVRKINAAILKKKERGEKIDWDAIIKKWKERLKQIR